MEVPKHAAIVQYLDPSGVLDLVALSRAYRCSIL